MAPDWKDLLGSLNLPQGEENESETALRHDSKPAAKKVTLFYETKGRGGKPVTILADFEGVTEQEIASLASDLKRSLGTGGSTRGGEILIQGDRRETLRKNLAARGFKVKG